MNEPPEGIIVTIANRMYREKGYRKWLRDFMEAMKRSETDEDWFYWLRQGNQPKRPDLRYVYLCIGGKIRFRCFFAGSHGAGRKYFSNHDKPIDGRAWVLIAGPVMKAPIKIEMHGFQGFRYTEKLF